MNVSQLTGVIILGTILVGCSTAKRQKKPEVVVSEPQVKVEMTYEDVARMIQDWPETSKEAANNMLSKYGLPQETTKSMLLWENTAPFKRTIVYNSELPHNFPHPHMDILEQTIEYEVPKEKVSELWDFNGSILLDRTKGEMSSRCEKEEMNILALNLADQIIRNKLSAREGRINFAEKSQHMTYGNVGLASSLNFIPNSETADPDMASLQYMQAEEERTKSEAESEGK